MKILFSMRHLGFTRLFEPVLRELSNRGHTLVVAADRRLGPALPEPAATIARDHPHIAWEESPAPARTHWSHLATSARLWRDYLRFVEPLYDDAPRLRTRAAEHVPEALVEASHGALFRFAPARRILNATLAGVERVLPTDAAAEAFLREHRPDVLMVTPLVFIGSSQVDIVRAARRLGIPTALAVGSWDHLSSKSLIREMPDRVLVWNDTQRREAETLHGVPAERIVVTGAQCYDQWFDRVPSRSREDFCRRVGLPADRPYVLYVCSSLFLGSPVEAELVRQWAAHVRGADDDRLRTASILVRPHPSRREQWERVDLSGLPAVRLSGENPVSDGAKADYFDSLYHAAAVVGLNTSAFLEAGIVGRPVLTIALPELYGNQEGTLHFRYLVDGGLLHLTRSFPDHLAQLAAAVEGRLDGGPASDFITAFIRPRGRNTSATGLFTDAVERMTELRSRPEPEPASHRLARAALHPLAGAVRRRLASDPRLLWIDRGAREEIEAREIQAFQREKARRREEAIDATRREREEKIARAQARQESKRRTQAQAREVSERQAAQRQREKERDKARRQREKRWRVRRERLKLLFGGRFDQWFGRTRDEVKEERTGRRA